MELRMHDTFAVPGPDGPANDGGNADPRDRERGSDSMKYSTLPQAIRDLFAAE